MEEFWAVLFSFRVTSLAAVNLECLNKEQDVSEDPHIAP
jgi:hypothetical protein